MDKKTENGKIINALRMGVIPDASLEKLIVGRKEEILEIKNVLRKIKEEDLSVVKIIKGDYGTGKTFLLDYMKAKALENNFVVASISISGGFNFSTLDLFYTNIMSNLSIKVSNNKGSSFEEIFELWIKKLMKDNNKNATEHIYNVISELRDYNTSFASVFLVYIRAKINKDIQLASIAAGWIKGDRNIPYELKKKINVKGSIDKENAMDIFKGFVKLLTLIGYSGMLIEVDEVELIMNNRIDTRMKAYSNIRYIMDACGSNQFEKCGFIFAGTNELFNNEEKGFKSYDALNQRIGKIIEGNNHIPNVRQPIISLDYCTEEELYMMTKKVLDIHLEYYSYRSETSIDTLYKLCLLECKKLNRNQKVSIRNYLKKLIELLDINQQNPSLPIFKVRM